MSIVQEVINEGLDRADMLKSKFISPELQLSYFNKGFADMFSVVISIYEDEFVIQDPLVIEITTQTLKVDLPADFYKMRGLDKFQGGGTVPSDPSLGDWFQVRKFNFLNRNKDNILRPINGLYPAVRYRLWGSQLLFDDPDNALGSYRLWYIPRPTVFASASDTVTFANQYRQDYVALQIAIRALIKEESDTTTVEREMAQMRDNIESFDRDRDSGEPETITDTQFGGDRAWYYGGLDVY